jgi:hypothetical protein
VRGFKVNSIVPKTYRKATKVMARDIELAVGATDCAVRDAGLTTPGTDAEAERTYPGQSLRCEHRGRPDRGRPGRTDPGHVHQFR